MFILKNSVMDLNFGEIVEPVSRAFWDSYEDPSDNDAYEDPKWKWLTENETVPDNKNLILVIEGENVTAFVNAAVLKNKSPLCQLNNGKCAVFDLPKNVLIVLSEEKNLNIFSSVTELLIPFLEKATSVSTLSILPAAVHRQVEKDDQESICYLRKMNSEFEDIKEFEEPNFISGIAAGVSTWRKFKDQPVSNYIAFMEAPVFDSVSTKPLLNLLSRIGVPCDSSFKGKITEPSNLYM